MLQDCLDRRAQKAVGAREVGHLRATRHGSIRIHQFAQHAQRLQPREAGEFD